MKLLYQHEVDYIKDKDPCFLKTSKSGEIAVNVNQIPNIRKRKAFEDYKKKDSQKLLIVCNEPWTEQKVPEYIFEPKKLYSDVLRIYDFWTYWKL